MFKMLYVIPLLFLLNFTYADTFCKSNFVNPINEVNWGCVMPITFAGATIKGGSPDTGIMVTDPMCECRDGAYSRIGFSIGFSEPTYMADIAKVKWCMPGLGADFSKNDPIGGGTATEGVASAASHDYFAQGHLMYYPAWAILGLFKDWVCMNSSMADNIKDIALMQITEVNPFHNRPLLAIWAQPEVLLYANPVMELACVADTVAANMPNGEYVSKFRDTMFWCAGGQGIGNMSGYTRMQAGSQVEQAQMVLNKVIYQSHREMILWNSSGVSAMCGSHPLPWWKKSMYKTQPVRPLVSQRCVPLGRSTLLWGQGLNPPIPGKNDNFTFMLFKKRDCCSI